MSAFVGPAVLSRSISVSYGGDETDTEDDNTTDTDGADSEADLMEELNVMAPPSYVAEVRAICRPLPCSRDCDQEDGRAT